jgi:spermidine/putrescine transport system permease protein
MQAAPHCQHQARAPASAQARLILFLLLAPALIWLVGLIVLPHIDLAVLSLRERIAPRQYAPSFAQYRTFIEEPLYWHTFVRTALMSILATGITLLLAFPIAWTIAKLVRGRAKSLLLVMCLIPFWVSETVRTLGWMILLRESGVMPAVLVQLGLTDAPVELLYRDATILVGLVYTSMLFMVVPLISALESLDDTLIEAAYDLGGNGPSILRQIVIPHAAPGILAGCIVVFMLTLGNYLTPTLLGGKNSLWFTEQIYTQFITRFNWEQGAAFGFLLLGLSTAIVWLGLKLTGQKFGEVMHTPGHEGSNMIASLPRPAWLRAGTVVYALAFFAFLFLPLVVVAVFAFNDAPYPAPPWRGFTLDWFFGSKAGRTGCFQTDPCWPASGPAWWWPAGSLCWRCWSARPTPF